MLLMGELSCQLYQRSADIFLGIPFNIASYALLTLMVAQSCNLEPGEFIHTLGDAHLYLNHLDQAREQLSRKPRELPLMKLNPAVQNILDYSFTDFTLENYNPYPAIKSPNRSMKPKIVLIAAVAPGGIIGFENKMPWHLPRDLRYFKRVTLGHPIVMGRKTFESLKCKALPGRRNIVVTRNKEYAAPDCEVVHSLKEAIDISGSVKQIFIIGGGQLYETAVPLADEIYLTQIEKKTKLENYLNYSKVTLFSQKLMPLNGKKYTEDVVFVPPRKCKIKLK